MNQVPQWLSRRIPSIMRSGQLLLTNERTVSDLRALSSPEFSRYLKSIKHLDVRGTPISSLEGLPTLPHLQSFIADGSYISSLKGFTAISSASKISLKNTPVSKEPTYKLSLVIIFGDNLSSIDNTIIPKTLKKKAKDYPPLAITLEDKGWMAEVPAPDTERIYELCERYDVVVDKSVQEIPIVEEEEEIDEFEDFEAVVQKFRDEQDAMFARAEQLFGITGEVNFEAELAERVAILFGDHGIAIDATNEDIIVKAIEDLCIKATTDNDRTPSSLTEEEEINDVDDA